MLFGVLRNTKMIMLRECFCVELRGYVEILGCRQLSEPVDDNEFDEVTKRFPIRKNR